MEYRPINPPEEYWNPDEEMVNCFDCGKEININNALSEIVEVDEDVFQPELICNCCANKR